MDERNESDKRNKFLETLKFDVAPVIENFIKYQFDYKSRFWSQAMQAHCAISRLFPEVDFFTVCRIKSFKSTLDKARKKGMENVFDIHGMRHVITSINEIDESSVTEDMLIAWCYRLQRYLEHYYENLGISIDPHRKKDYIKTPKKNGYQALHMSGVVEYEDSRRFESQIKTVKMDQFAKHGNANHAERYKPRELGENPLISLPTYAVIKTQDGKPVFHELTTAECFQYFYNVPYSEYLKKRNGRTRNS